MYDITDLDTRRSRTRLKTFVSVFGALYLVYKGLRPNEFKAVRDDRWNEIKELPRNNNQLLGVFQTLSEAVNRIMFVEERYVKNKRKGGLDESKLVNSLDNPDSLVPDDYNVSLDTYLHQNFPTIYEEK